MIAHLALIVALQSPLDNPVSYEGKAARLDAVLTELGKQAGVEIKVQGAPLRDYVYVNIRRRPLRSILDLVAEACQAEWRQEKDRIVLAAPWPSSNKAGSVQKWLDENQITKELSNSDLAGLAQQALDLMDSEDGQSKQSRTEALSNELPLRRAHLQLLHHLGAAEIDALGEGETRFHATVKASLFTLFSSPASKSLRSLASQSDQLRSELLKKGADLRMRSWSETIAPYLQADFASLEWLMSLHHDGERIESQLIGFDDADGSVKAATGLVINSDMDTNENKLQAITEAFQAPPYWSETFLPALSPELRSRLALMNEDEVVTDYINVPLRQLAEARGKDIIAIIPDLAFYPMMVKPFSLARTGTIGDLLHRAYAMNAWVREDETHLLLRPANLSTWRAARVLRNDAPGAIRDGLRRGSVSLDALAAVARASETNRDWQSSTFAISLAVRDTLTSSADREVLKAYDLLPAGVRKDAKDAPVKMVWRDLQRSQQQLLLNAALANSFRITQGGAAQMLKFRDGVPPDAPVLLDVKRRDHLYGRSRPSSRPVKLTLSQYAEAQARLEAGTKTYTSDFKEFCIAAEATVSWIIGLTPPDEIEVSTTVEGPNRDQEFHAFDKLPQSIQDEYHRLLKIHRDSIRGQGPSGQNSP